MLADPALAPDGALLQEYAKNRDADAYAELARRYAGLVYGTCRRVLGNEDDAQDVAQECFLELARKAGTVHSSLPAWLHKLARSRSVDAIRKAAARRRAEERAAQEPGEDSDPTWAELAPYVDEALEGLPERLRVPIILHYLQGHTQAQVAAELGVHQSTVSRQLENGILALREHLKKAGVIASAAALGVLLTDNASTAAPSALAAALGKIAISGIGASSVAPTYHIGGLVVKKVWLHTAVAAIVFVLASALVVPRIAAKDTSQKAPTSAASHSTPGKRVIVQVKVEFIEVPADLLGDLQTRFHFKSAGTDKRLTTVLDAAEAKALGAKLLASGGKITSSPMISTISGQPCYISIASLVPYTVETRDQGGTVISSTPREAQIQSGFNLVPTVNADGSITVDISLIVSPASATSAANTGPSFRGKITPGGAMALAPAGNGTGNRRIVVVTPSVVERTPKQGS